MGFAFGLRLLYLRSLLSIVSVKLRRYPQQQLLSVCAAFPHNATHLLLHASPSDIPTFTTIYLSAFTDPLALTAFPRSSPNISAWWTAINLSDFHSQPSACFLKIVERKETDSENERDSAENEKIIAYAKWNVLVRLVGGEGIVSGGDDADAMPLWPEGADVELCEDVFPAFARERGRRMGGRRMGGRAHYCTLPSFSFSPRLLFPSSFPHLFSVTPFPGPRPVVPPSLRREKIEVNPSLTNRAPQTLRSLPPSPPTAALAQPPSSCAGASIVRIKRAWKLMSRRRLRWCRCMRGLGLGPWGRMR